MKKLTRGTRLRPYQLLDIRGNTIDIPEPRRWTHIQFRRYSGCVICNLHIQEIISRQHEISASGIQEVIFFQSPEHYLQTQFAGKAVTIIADPKLVYYREFGVENSIMSIANPSAWGPGFTGIFRFGLQLPQKGESPLGLPADFLVDEEGYIIDLHYGKHAYDQWSIDHLLNLVKQLRVIV